MIGTLETTIVQVFHQLQWISGTVETLEVRSPYFYTDNAITCESLPVSKTPFVVSADIVHDSK